MSRVNAFRSLGSAIAWVIVSRRLLDQAPGFLAAIVRDAIGRASRPARVVPRVAGAQKSLPAAIVSAVVMASAGAGRLGGAGRSPQRGRPVRP